jgi:polyphenol oxidase
MRNPFLIRPKWPVPRRVRAFITTRVLPSGADGSKPPFNAFNLADHVGDDTDQVRRNRALLAQHIQLPGEPCWLRQVHGNNVIEASPLDAPAEPAEADAAWTTKSNAICAVLTADCLPLLLSDREGTAVAAVHAGWRGLHNGIITKTVQTLPVPPQRLLAWLGPAIGPRAYEVDRTVYEQFLALDPGYGAAFTPSDPGHWHFDLYRIARMQLEACGIEEIYGGDRCTYRETGVFYSYRREGKTGRMASLIWLA